MMGQSVALIHAGESSEIKLPLCLPRVYDNQRIVNSMDHLLTALLSKLRTRIGLVPNYFITRGEAIPQEQMFSSFESFIRKTVEGFLKLFFSKDFRDKKSFDEFDRILKILGEASGNGGQDEVTSLLNRRSYEYGNNLLQTLIRRRQLKFVKSLLLHCGNCIDLNQRNQKGQNALDLGVDRLEVEIVFLLLLYGAKPSEIPANNSLGWTEWIKTDMLANLDTGRWLNKKSIDAVMEFAESFPLPRKALLDWAHHGTSFTDADIKTLGRLPQLYSITLADGCDAITNHEAWATLVRYLLRLHEKKQEKKCAGVTHPSYQTGMPADVPTPVPCEDFYEFLESFGVDPSTKKVAGRTIFYSCVNGEEIAVKFSKSYEDDMKPHPLAKEAAMNSKMTDLKVKYGLKSDHPTNIGLLMIKKLPTAIRQAISDQQAQGFHAFQVSDDCSGITALVYRPPKGYSCYANDPSISIEDSLSGILKATFDFAVLARNGFYHGAMVDIQHDSTREQRPHLWSFESFLTRFRGGAGRIDRGFAGLSSPNVRASGLGDLKHIIDVEEVKHRYDPSVIHAQHNQLYDNHECFQVALVEQVGAGLFAAALLVGSSWQGRHAIGMTSNENIDLALALKDSFSVFLQGYLDVNKARADVLLELMGTHFDMMAQQIMMFATNEYVSVAEAAPRRPIFGATAKVLGALTHPTAFPHFCQRGSRPLQQPTQSLEQIRAVYKPKSPQVLPEGYPRVDTSMTRSSPTWKRGRGWASPDGHAHFGSYEGVLPFQHLIRDLYAVVYLALMLHIQSRSTGSTY